MSIFILAFIIMLCCIIGCTAWVYLVFFRQSEQDITLSEDKTTENLPLIQGDRFAILPATQLIQILDLQPSLNHIHANLGLSDENWTRDALPFLHRYIELVQRLPASESHHHAGDGGLVKHTLDVAALALAASTAQSWPPNAKTEDIAKKTAVWRFGIMCAAILHDVGKTITSFQIYLYDNPLSSESVMWLADTGHMADTGKSFYQVTFPDKKTAYATHTEIAWTFFQALTPKHVRQWMAATDPDLVVTLREYLSGRKQNAAFDAVITQADMASVARDLKTGSRQRFASAKRTPLIETIMDTLRDMLAQRGAYFSIAVQAGGDLFRQGDHIYMIAKNVPDAIRQYLRSTQHRAAASFPSDNQRIFDTLLEYGVAIPVDGEPHRAIHSIQVTFTKADGEVKEQTFTVLCFKAASLYPNHDYPEPFQGTLIHLATAPVATHSKQAAAPVDKTPFPIQQQAPDTTIQTKPAKQAEPAKQGHAPAQAKTHQPVSMPSENPPPLKSSQRVGTNYKKKSKTTSTLSFKGIDELLEQHQLLDEPLEEADTTEAESAPSNIQQTGPANIQTASHSHNTISLPQPSTSISSPSPRPQKGHQFLQELFHDTAKQTLNQDDTNIVLAESETAQHGMQESEQQRASLPSKTPRPVHVFETLSLEVLTSVRNVMKQELAKVKTDNPYQSKPKESNALQQNNLHMREKGAQFLQWLAAGIADGSIAINCSGAPIHFVEQGMLLVTPAIFRDYAGGIFNKSDTSSLGVQAQKGFERLRLHHRNKKTALFRAIANNDSHKRLFFCYLIPEKHLHHIIQTASRPQNNTQIRLDEDHNLLDLST